MTGRLALGTDRAVERGVRVLEPGARGNRICAVARARPRPRRRALRRLDFVHDLGVDGNGCSRPRVRRAVDPRRSRDRTDPGGLLVAALILRLTLASALAIALAIAAPALTQNPELVAGLRLASLLGLAGAAYGCFGSLLRSQPRWLPLVLGIETAWLAAQVGASWWIVHRGGGIVPLVGVSIATQLAEIATAIALWRAVFGDRASRMTPPPLLATLRRAARLRLPALSPISRRASRR